MANHVGAPLSRLIRDRAYAAGVLASRAERVRRAEAALAVAISRRAEAEALVAQLDARLAVVPLLEQAEIRAIQHIPKSGLFQYGELACELVRILTASSPGSVSTSQIIAEVSLTLGLPSEKAARAVTRRRIVKQLQKYVRKGAIERLHDPTKPNEGQWRWKGLDIGTRLKALVDTEV